MTPPPATDPRDLASRLERSRSRALERFRSGRWDGPTTSATLSRTLDRFFRTALRPWVAGDCRFAVLALGSYGRAGLSLHSDVDCVLLHSGAEPRGPVDAISAAVRALWDIGIRARVAVYSPSRAQRLAARDARVLASLLDSRFVAGSPSSAEELREAIAGLPDRHVRQLARLIRREDEARTGTRHLDLFAAEPDVKSGQGGLRDLAALGWFQRWARLGTHRILARGPVRALLREVARRGPVLDEARTALLTARLLLDVAGLPRDRFTREAAWILERQRVPSYAPVAFERDLAMARMQVSGLLKALVDGVLGRAGPAVPTDDLAIRVAVSRDRRVRASPIPLPPSPPMGVTIRVPPVATRAFLDILSARRPGPALDTLLRTGVLHRVVPGFHRAVGVVVGDEVHAFTLDRHLVLAAAEAADIVDGVAPTAPGTEEAIRSGERHRVPLLLAALLHDLGKTMTVGASGTRPSPAHAQGSGGAPLSRFRSVHPEVGARLARVAALKLGLPRDEADLVAFLCRHHMVLPDASTTLDCESPEVLDRLARVLGNAERLDLVLLLGTADLRSLGPETAMTFREALLGRAWSAVRRRLAAGDGVDGWGAEAEARRTRLRAWSSRLPPGSDWPDGLIRALPERLLMAFDPDRLASYLVQFQAVRTRGPRVIVEAVASPGCASPDLDVTYLGQDEMGLLSRLSGAMTLQGLSIQEARIFSIGTGGVAALPLVLDQFRVTDPGGGIGESGEAREALADRILASAADPTVARRIQGRVREALRPRGAEMVAEVDNTSLPDRTVFRVAGPDTPGLLHVLADILYRHGINVTGAIVMTEAGTARDTFFAEWAASGGKVLDPEVIRKVLRAIAGLGRTP